MSRSFAASPARAALAALAFAFATPAAAQETYPNRPIMLTHGFAAGGNGDIISRIVGEGAVATSRPASRHRAAARRRRQYRVGAPRQMPPDGYTLIT